MKVLLFSADHINFTMDLIILRIILQANRVSDRQKANTLRIGVLCVAIKTLEILWYAINVLIVIICLALEKNKMTIHGSVKSAEKVVLSKENIRVVSLRKLNIKVMLQLINTNTPKLLIIERISCRIKYFICQFMVFLSLSFLIHFIPLYSPLFRLKAYLFS